MVRRNTLEQVYFTAVQALPMILPIAILIGAMIIVQFSKFSGQYDLGKITVLIIVRELGPIVTAFLIILRSATAVTIEISYMNVLNEMDALEMSGLDPLWVICVPRLVGITSAILCLFIVFDIVAIVGGYAIVWIITYINLGEYLLQIANAISVADITVGIIKAIIIRYYHYRYLSLSWIQNTTTYHSDSRSCFQSIGAVLYLLPDHQCNHLCIILSLKNETH